MHLKEFPDWHDVVAKHWRRTAAYLLAFREPCIEIRRAELEAVRKNRVLVSLDGKRLSVWRPSGSWFLAVILCPEDDIAPLVEWMRDGKKDASRVHFYAHPDTAVFEVLRPWADAKLGAPRVDDDVDAWPRFHKRFGRDLSVRILQDHR